MPKVSVAFFTVAALCGLTGMVWGSYMGASGDHSLMSAHAHLNLLGWVSLAIMGAFYALPAARPGRLAWINLALSATGAVVMAPMLAALLSGRQAQVGPFMPFPEALVILGMLCFAVSVARAWRSAN